MRIIVVQRGRGDKFGARKYGTVNSFTSRRTYKVIKRRLPGKSRNYQYKCSCPDAFFRSRQCKHIEHFKKAENEKS